MTRARLTAVLVAATTLALPGAAFAAPAQSPHAVPTPRYVAKNGADVAPCGVGAPCKTVQFAADHANAGDTINIGVGTFVEAVFSTTPLSYVGAGSGTPTSAQGATVIESPTVSPALGTFGDGQITDLRLVGSTVAAGGIALEVQAPHDGSASNQIRRVAAFAGIAPDTTSSYAIYITGQNNGVAGALIEDSYAESVGTPASPAVAITSASGGSASANIEGTTIVGGSNSEGIDVVGGDLTLSDSDVTAGASSTAVAADGTLTVNNSTLSAQRTALLVSGSGTLEVRNSVLSSSPTSTDHPTVWIDRDQAGATSRFEGSTITARSNKDRTVGMLINAQFGIVELNSTAIHAAAPDQTLATGEADIQTTDGSTPTFTVSHSSYTTTIAGTGTTIPAAGSGTNVNGGPGFVDWANGDLHLTPTSPLVDHGDPASAHNGETDLAGAARSIDGDADCNPVPDIGAYELTGHVGVPPVATAAGPDLVGAKPATFTATPTTGYDLAWKFSDGATATGATVQHAFTSSGPATATVTAKHGACVGTAAKTFTVDATPPTISGFKVSPNKLTALKAGTVFVTKGGVKLTLTQSEAADLTYTFAKVLPGRTVKGKCVAPSSHNTKAKKCSRYTTVGHVVQKGSAAGAHALHLSGRLNNKPLPAGTYRLQVGATDALGNVSKTVTLTFTVQAPHKAN